LGTENLVHFHLHSSERTFYDEDITIEKNKERNEGDQLRDDNGESHNPIVNNAGQHTEQSTELPQVQTRGGNEVEHVENMQLGSSVDTLQST